MTLSWTVEPPEFAAYVSSVRAVDLGPDALVIEVDMRCKRVSTSSQECADDDGLDMGKLDVCFGTGVAPTEEGGTMRLDHPDDDIIWPLALGPWNGPPPILTVHHGRVGFRVRFSERGRYTTSVLLLRPDLPRVAVDGPPCGHDHVSR